eukprot:3935589-Pleurochrysis_carterae.AAC.1
MVKCMSPVFNKFYWTSPLHILPHKNSLEEAVRQDAVAVSSVWKTVRAQTFTRNLWANSAARRRATARL